MASQPVYAQWNGGVNYGPAYFRDTEVFPSIRQAREALQERARVGHFYEQEFRYADGRSERVLTPCADEGAYMLLFTSLEAAEEGEAFRLLEVGPRGGIKESAA